MVVPLTKAPSPQRCLDYTGETQTELLVRKAEKSTLNRLRSAHVMWAQESEVFGRHLRTWSLPMHIEHVIGYTVW